MSSPDTPRHIAYRAATQVLGDCPLEAGYSYLADHECPCGNLPTPKYPWPACGCWPRNAHEQTLLRAGISLTRQRETPLLLETLSRAEQAAAAIRLVRVEGMTVRAAARHLDIPRRVVATWVSASDERLAA